MTTKDFIQKHYGIAGGVRTINSVMIDAKGNAYSYGYHYPLLFRVNGLDFINTRGYSNTTSKHISWARGAATNPINIEVPLRTCYDGEINLTIKDVLELLGNMRQAITKEMDSKKRKDTWVYKDLVRQYEQVNRDMLTVVGVPLTIY